MQISEDLNYLDSLDITEAQLQEVSKPFGPSHQTSRIFGSYIVERSSFIADRSGEGYQQAVETAQECRAASRRPKAS